MQEDNCKNPYLWLALLILLVTVGNFVWIAYDTRPQPFIDPFPEKTLRFIDGLNEKRIYEIPWEIMKMSVGSRPPLYQLFSAPFMLFVERSADSMLIVNGFFLIVLAVSTFKIAEIVLNTKAGLLAALIVLTYPPIVNLSKIARPHAVYPATVALSLWLLLRLWKTRSVKNAWVFGASLALNFLIHPNTFYALVLPTIFLGGYLAFFQKEPRWPRNGGNTLDWALTKLRNPFLYKGLLPAAAITVIPTALWYGPMLTSALELYQRVATLYTTSTRGFNFEASFWWYAQTTPGAISNFFVILLVGAVPLGILLQPPGKKSSVVLLSTLLALIYFGMGFLKGGPFAWMNFALILPVAAAVTAVGIMVVVQRLSMSDTPANESSIKEVQSILKERD